MVIGAAGSTGATGEGLGAIAGIGVFGTSLMKIFSSYT